MKFPTRLLFVPAVGAVLASAGFAHLANLDTSAGNAIAGQGVAAVGGLKTNMISTNLCNQQQAVPANGQNDLNAGNAGGKTCQLYFRVDPTSATESYAPHQVEVQPENSSGSAIGPWQVCSAGASDGTYANGAGGAGFTCNLIDNNGNQGVSTADLHYINISADSWHG